MPALSKDVVAGHMKCLSRDIFRPVWTITPPVDLQMARGLAYEGTERDSFSGMQDYSGWTSHLARGREGGRKGGGRLCVMCAVLCLFMLDINFIGQLFGCVYPKNVH